MKEYFRKRTLILISTLVAIAITSTAAAQVTIVNQYSMSVAPVVPPVHLETGLANSSSVSEYVNSVGSVAYANLTERFTLGGMTSVNLSALLKMPSTSPDSFIYLTNVSDFNGQNRVNEVKLYSLMQNGTYYSDFSYNSTTGYSNSTAPVTITGKNSSSIGLSIQVGKSAFGGPYTWYLDFEVDGYMTSPGHAPSVYTQYFVHIKVTTIELA